MSHRGANARQGGLARHRLCDAGAPRRQAIRVVESRGFVPSGRVWRREDWSIDVDLLGSELESDRRHFVTVQTPSGPVLVVDVKDLIVRWFAELKHWHPAPRWRADLVRQVTILLSEHGDRLDEEHLAFLARRDDVIDILADFRRQLRSRRA